MSQLLEIDADRLWSTIEVSASIGTHKTGLRRLALSDEDKAMRDQFVAWAREAGYGVTVDQVGNIFVRREGSDPSLPPIVVGSHLDTTIEGGRFDGILGVLGGLEVLRSLDDAGVTTRRAIEVVNWTDEEGSRFSMSMMGSHAWTGAASLEDTYAFTDKDGKRFGDELERIGYKGEAPLGDREFDCFIELHIEQAPELDEEDLDIGLVTGSYNIRGYRVMFEGETAHIGPTPMDRRHNALIGAGYMIGKVNDIGLKYAASKGKTTCAKIDVWPNIYGILPSEVELTIDYRHADMETLGQMKAELDAALIESCERAQVTSRITKTWKFGDDAFDPKLFNMMREIAPKITKRHKEMLGQAGHDAYALASYGVPTVMIFTPCKDGITHNTAEDVDWNRTLPGLNLLLNLAEQRANRS